MSRVLSRQQLKRDELQDWLRFTRAEAHILRERPHLLFQQAANQQSMNAPAEVARLRFEAGLEKRPWLRLVWSHSVSSRSWATIKTHQRAVTACAFSPAGDTVATADTDLEDFRDDTTVSFRWPDPWKESPAAIRLRRFPDPSGEERFAETSKGGVSCLDFSPDGGLLAAGLWDGTLRLYDARSLELLSVLDKTDEGISSCRFSPSGELIAYCTRDIGTNRPPGAKHVLKIVNVESGDCLLEHFPDHGLYSCDWSSDEKFVAASSEDGSVSFFEVGTRSELQRVNAHESGPAYCCRFIPGTHTVISGARDGRICVCDVESPERKRSLDGGKGNILSLAISHDGALVAAGTYFHTIEVWSLASGSCLLTLYEHSDMVHALCFSPDDRYLCSGAGDRLVKIWEIQELVRDVRPEQAHDFIIDADISVDGTECLIASSSGAIRRYDLSSSNEVSSLQTDSEGISFCKFAGADRSVVFAGRRCPPTIWRGDATVAVKSLVPAHGREPIEMRLMGQSYDWTKCLVNKGSGRALFVSDLAIGGVSLPDAAIYALRTFRHFMGPRLWAYSTSPDGRYLLMGDDEGKLREYDIAFGQPAPEKLGRFLEYVNAADYSPDGETIVVCTGTGSRSEMRDRACLQLVDVRSKNRFEFRGHSNSSDVACCRYLPSGDHIASASKAGELFLWNSQDGVPTKIGERFVDSETVSVPQCTVFTEGDIRRLSCSANHILVSGLYSAQVFEIQNVELGFPLQSAKRDGGQIELLCPGCGRTRETSPSALGHEYVCPHCGGKSRLNRLVIEDWLGASVADLAATVLQRAVDVVTSDPRGSLRELQTLPEEVQAVLEVKRLIARCHCEVAVVAVNQDRDIDTAIDHLEMASAIAPDSREIRRQLADAKRAKTQADEASLLQYALERYSAGDVAAALEAASRVPASSPVYRLARDLIANSAYELGMLSAAMGELERALDYLRQARKCRPRDPVIAKAWKTVRKTQNGRGWFARLLSRSGHRAG